MENMINKLAEICIQLGLKLIFAVLVIIIGIKLS